MTLRATNDLLGYSTTAYSWDTSCTGELLDVSPQLFTSVWTSLFEHRWAASVVAISGGPSL